MNHEDLDPLLRQVLAGEELDEFRNGSLQRGLAAFRHRHRQRQLARWTALVCVPFLLALGLLTWKSMDESATWLATSNSVRLAASSSTPPVPPVEFISDEQLFALFPHCALALVGKPGQQQLILLGKLDASTSR